MSTETVKFFLPHPDQQVIHMLKRNGFEWCTKIEEADFIVFTGGADVHPALYGERKHPTTDTDAVRDNKDIKAWNSARADQIKIGICRGGQFLNVMNGGKLYQNVTNHAIRGTHKMYSKDNGKEVLVTSTHHQMMIPHSSGTVLYVARLAMTKEEFGKTKRYSREERDAVFDDVEVVVYEKTRSLCYQPHPEYEERDNKGNEILFIELILEMLAGGKIRPTSSAILGPQRTEAGEETRSTVRH